MNMGILALRWNDGVLEMLVEYVDIPHPMYLVWMPVPQAEDLEER